MPSQNIEVFDMDQNSDAWLKIRSGIPTASSFQCLMAESADRKGRATYMRKIAGEIISGVPNESFRTEAMDRGHAMEDDARRKYAFMCDAEPELVGFIRNGARGCSPDALIGTDGLLEIKTQRPDILIETILKDEFPSAHKAQTQGGLLISERDWCDIVVFYTGMPWFCKRAYRDVKYIAALSRAIDEFNEETAELVEKIRRYGTPAQAKAA